MGAALVRQGLRSLRRFGLHPIDERLHFRPGRGIPPADDVVREARRPGLVQRQDKPAGFDIFPGVRVLHQRDALPGAGGAQQQLIVFIAGAPLRVGPGVYAMRLQPQRPIRAVGILQQRVLQAIFG
ncbi:hypothetical protein G6F32_014998 [Rhizopus arrhizus]|nr:hypothetical protein G6F32_014998 [Rhizopus arrhizus]